MKIRGFKCLLKSKCLFFWFSLQVNVRVTTMDAELEFSFHPNTTGKQLFDQVGMILCEKAPDEFTQIHGITLVLAGNLIAEHTLCTLLAK